MAEQRVRYVIEAQNLLSKVLRQLEGEASKTGAAIEGIGKGGGGIGGKGGMMTSIAGGNLLASGIQRAAGAMVEFGKQSVQSFAKFEQFGIALTTMFHGNREEAKMLSDELVNFAKRTPFELTEIQDATKQLIAYGSTSGSVGKELQILGDISSGVGAPISEIAYLYGTARTQGRLFSRDIYQFSGRGIPIVQALAKQFKVADNEVMKLVEDGKVGFGDLQKAMVAMTEKGGQFAGMMEAQSKSLGGQLSNLSDSWEQLKVNIGGSQQGILKDTIKWASDMLNSVNTSMRQTNAIEEAVGHSINSSRLASIIKGTGAALTMPFTGYAGYHVAATQYGKAANTGNREELLGVQGKIDEILSTATDKQSSMIARNQIAYQMALTKGKFDVGAIDRETLNDEMKMLNFSIAKIAEREKIKGTKGDLGLNSATAGKDKLSKDKLGTGTTIESGAPKNMYINVNKLVETLKVESVSGEIPASQIKTQVSKVFLEMLNDAHLAQR